MAFLSCEEMLAAARSQKITLAEAVLRSDLEESRLTEAHSRAAMRHLWQVMQATSQEYDPTQRSRSGLSGGDAAKVEQAWQQGRLLGDDYLAAVTAEALKTAECNACMKRIVAAPTASLDVNKKFFKCKRLVICAQEPDNPQKALTMLIEKRYKDEDTGSDSVNSFPKLELSYSACVYFFL